MISARLIEIEPGHLTWASGRFRATLELVADRFGVRWEWHVWSVTDHARYGHGSGRMYRTQREAALARLAEIKRREGR